METEKPAAASSRPSPVLLVLLGLAVVAFFVHRLGGSAGTDGAASNVRGAPAAVQAEAALDPALLDVRLEALASERPGFGDAERNPFRFQPRVVAPPPGGSRPPAVIEEGPVAPLPPPQAAGPPPITIRFIGFVDREDGRRMAVFVDCSVGRRTSHAREGEIVDGRYRLVKVGLTSVVVEHLDGRGRTTLPLTGQECVGR